MFLWVCKARLWGLTRKDGKCEKNLLQFFAALKILIQNLVSSTFGTSHNLASNEEGKKPGASQFERLNTKTEGENNELFSAHKYDTIGCSYEI